MIDEVKVAKALGLYTDLINIVATMDNEELFDFRESVAMVNLLIKVRIKEAGGDDTCD